MNRKQRRADNRQGGAVAHPPSPAVGGMFAAALQDHQAGRLKEAELRYRQVLACDSRHADSLHLLGVVGCQTGRPALAAEMIGKAIAINAGIAAYHSNLGIALQELGRPDAAIACWHKAIALQPDYPEAHNSLGVALKRQGRLEEAVACYRRAIDLRPQYPQALNNLGSALQEAGRLEEAIACWRRALELGPDLPEAHNNLGNVLMDQGRLEEAVACYRRAIGLRPEQPTAHNHLGSALKDQGRLDESAVAYRRALDLRPDYPEPHNNLGTVLREQGRLDEAAACHRRAIGLRPDYALAHHNLALVLLARGEMAEGWREYEWRWQCPHRRQAWRNFARPQWRGEAAVGRTLLIHAEQGFGDTLQFCRYTPLAAASGLRVIIEAPKPLVRLLRCLDGADRVVEAGTPLPEFDLHCPMLSLPLALGTTLTTIPAAAYLRADPLQEAGWRTRLAKFAVPGRRIGLAWAGNPALPADARRSLPPALLAPLFAVPDLHFVSLQKGGPPVPADFPLTDVMDEMTDFADTASLIAGLDLVIAVDTAVAHLAAALGRPVWLLDRFDPCWRWLTGRRDSPWYPTLRLYRQPAPGDWDCVIAEVVGDLRRFARAEGNGNELPAPVSGPG